MRRRGTIHIGLTATATCALPVLSRVVQVAPSEEEIIVARAVKKATKISVAQTEVKLAKVSTRVATTTQNTQTVGEGLSEASTALSEATETATRASSEADVAGVAFQEGKQQIVSIAQVVYRGGGGMLDLLASYLDPDGLRTIETKQAGINSSSSSAEVKTQNVAVLEQIVKMIRDATNSAFANQQVTTDAVKVRTSTASEAAAIAQDGTVIVAVQRGAYMQELAAKQNMTVNLIDQREAALEVERQETVRTAAEQVAAATDAQRQTNTAAAIVATVAAAPFQASPSSDDEDDDNDHSYPVPPYLVSSYSYEESSYSMPSYSGGGTDTATAIVKSYLDVPCVQGGEPYGSVDCPGSTMLVWESADAGLPRPSRTQYSHGVRVPIGSMEAGDPTF